MKKFACEGDRPRRLGTVPMKNTYVLNRSSRFIVKFASFGSPMGGALFLPFSSRRLFASAADYSINVWWPTDTAHLAGLQPFKAQVEWTGRGRVPDDLAG
jgi:hypothetical protein